MSSNFTYYLFKYAGLGVILTYYALIISSLSPFSDYKIFLSLSIATDSSYLNLLVQEEFIPFKEGISFSFIPFFFDKAFVSLFGIQNLWMLNIFYKCLAFIVLLKGITTFLEPNRTQLLLLSIMVATFFCIDFPPFADRYPRPQFSNIFFFAIFSFNLCLLKKIDFHKFYFLFYGISHLCLALTNPWSLSAIIIMSFFSLFKYKSINATLFTFLGLALSTAPILIFYHTNLSSNHSEYLGLKIIYEPLRFYIDYFFTILSSKRIIILFSVLFASSFFLKRTEEIKIFILSFVFMPIPFLILGKTIQTYHLLESLRDLLIMFCIINICYFIKINNIKIWNFSIVKFNYLSFTAVTFISISLIFIYGNGWLDRAHELRVQSYEYNEIYKYLDDAESDCKLISNDINISNYWSHIKNSKTFPEDGFIRNSSIEDALEEVKISISLLSKLDEMNTQDINKIIRFATHNYYANTRSTITSSLLHNKSIDMDEYLNLNENINSMKPWAISNPKEIYHILNKKGDSPLFLKSDRVLVLYSKLNKEKIEFKVINYCF